MNTPQLLARYFQQERPLCAPEKIQFAFDTLDEREQKILHERFISYPPPTLDEVGGKFGVTRERIRTLQNIALVKMRRHIDNLLNPPIPLTPSQLDELRLDTLEELPIRVRSSLFGANIRTVGQLRLKTTTELLHIPNFGKKSFWACRDALRELGVVTTFDE